MVATLFVAARISGDGFAQTVERYDAFVHGESFGLRCQKGEVVAGDPRSTDAELSKSWDDQFKALEHGHTFVRRSQPTLRSIVASLSGEVL